MTDAYWQSLVATPPPGPPYAERYGARMPDGRFLIQPLRQLPTDPDHAVASLIATQASFAVERALSGWLAEAVRGFAAEVVVGLPTLGLVFARPVAEALGHANWVAAGYSRKFWYDAALSEPITSITSPGQEKRLWLDPRMLGRLEGRRVLLIDDVISTGTSIAAGLRLLARAGVRPVAIGAAMLQTRRWSTTIGDAPPIAAVFATPIFRRLTDGWEPEPGTLADSGCALLHSAA